MAAMPAEPAVRCKTVTPAAMPAAVSEGRHSSRNRRASRHGPSDADPSHGASRPSRPANRSRIDRGRRAHRSKRTAQERFDDALHLSAYDHSGYAGGRGGNSRCARPAGCGELVDRALRSIAPTVALRRGHLIVIGCLRLQAGHAHAKNRLGMRPVELDARLRRLAEVLGIRPVVYDGEMSLRTPGVVGSPPDDGQVRPSPFERRPFDDLDVLGFRRRRNQLSDGGN
jgi:hypothetical protein